MTKEEAHAIMDDAIDKLGEHFDCVQICVTEHEDQSGTKVFYRGSGNFFARTSICRTFARRDESSEQAQFIAQELKSEDD